MYKCGACIAVLMIFVLAAVFNEAQCSGFFQHHIHINPATGLDHSDCLTSNDTSSPCANLTWVFQQDRSDSTHYVLSEGLHYLTEPIPDFQGLTSLAFTGTGSVITCTDSDSGLAFIDVEDVTFHNITFQNCSSLMNSTSGKYSTNRTSHDFQLYKSLVALYFHRCQDITMTSVTVTKSPHATAVAMYNTIGTNLIKDSYFTFNHYETGTADYPGGGGFYIEFTYCVPGDNSCEDFDGSIASFNSNASFLFHNVVFKCNKASNLKDAKTYIIPNGKIHNAFGKGGGLAIIFKGNASDNMFEITECNFEENEASWGGGLLIEYQDHSSNNSVLIHESTFSDNRGGVSSETAGGGIRVGHYLYDLIDYPFATRNRVHIEKCELLRNHAISGGGISVLPARQLHASESQVFELTIRDTSFTDNRAQVGAALECVQFSLFVKGQLPSVLVGDSRFLNNSIHDDDDDEAEKQTKIREVGMGVVYTNGIPVQFRNEIVFEGNEGSALAVVGTFADFSNSSATFTANKGYNGGAINLLGSAFLLINSLTNMTFERNKADVYGGAITNAFIGRENFKTLPNCFLHHAVPFKHPNDWGAAFRFVDNEAGLLGQSIYTTSLLPCAWAGGSGSSELAEILCWEGWQYVKNNVTVPCQSEINTDGVITKEFENCSAIFDDSFAIQAFPGMEFEIPICIQDELGTDVKDETVFTAKSLDTTAQVNQRYTFTSKYVQVDGIEDSNITLQLLTTNERAWELEVAVQLHKCPPGFTPTNNIKDESKCMCNDKSYNGLVHCSPDSETSSVISGYWFGLIPKDNNESMEVETASLCLPGFCREDDNRRMIEIPTNYSDNNNSEWICSETRQGVLCGECRDGHGTSVNTDNFECVPCNDSEIPVNVIKYIFSVYFPLFLLFVFILVFSVRLTSGPANAFIFYAQVVSSTFDLNADSHIPLNHIKINENKTISYKDLLVIYRFPYGVFNLDFVEQFINPFCLGTGLSTVDVLELDYLIALFPLLMILTMIMFVKTKDRLSGSIRCFRYSFRRSSIKFLRQWKAGESLLHIFSAFLLLSYTKFSLTSSYLVNLHPFYDLKGNKVGTLRPYFAGHLKENSVEYILQYQIPAIVVLILIATPPIMLLGYPVILFEKCIIKIDTLWRWYPADKVQIFLDTFQGCYKDNRRFFAGMYFVFRLTINICYIITESWLQQFVAQQIICTIFIFIVCFSWPYRDEKWYVNYVDLLIFTNLAIVNGLSLYLFVYSKILESTPSWPFIVQYILVFLPLIYMVVYVILYLMTASQKEYVKHLATMLTTKLLRRGKENSKTTLLGPSRGPPSNAAPGEKDPVSITEVPVRSDWDSAPLDVSPCGSDVDDMDAILIRAQTENTYRSTASVRTPYQEWVYTATMASRKSRRSSKSYRERPSCKVSYLCRPKDLSVPNDSSMLTLARSEDSDSTANKVSQSSLHNYGSTS